MIRVALNHKTIYQYDRLVQLGPQVVRLRPAPHCRTPVCSYSMKVHPKDHFLNWQQDPHSNYLSRLVFSNPTNRFEVEVDLIVEMTVINPFDFFLEDDALEYPFQYDATLAKDLKPFLDPMPAGPKLAALVHPSIVPKRKTIDFLVDLNRQIQNEISYLIRLEPGVQSPEQTLTLGSGSCRDSAWLLVQALRHLGLASRFVSGYLIQLRPDVESLDGPSGAAEDFTDLHAWTEVFLPVPAGLVWTRPRGYWPVKATSRSPAPPNPIRLHPSPVRSVNAKSNSATRCRSPGFTKIPASPNPTPRNSGKPSNR